ncbi:MAG: holo-ACP synthase [Spirochaetales bacterium]|nr:holo-ACP synthase [Spirochaetales bacterium]
MILGVGVDIVHIYRLERWAKIPGIFERFFHPEELAEARTRGSAMVMALAARFAAKEAFGKALGTGLTGIRLADIRVITNFNGKPDIVVYDTALAAQKRAGGGRIHISLTHERDNAVAFVVLED